jgi:hypothetical protein
MKNVGIGTRFYYFNRPFQVSTLVAGIRGPSGPGEAASHSELVACPALFNALSPQQQRHLRTKSDPGHRRHCSDMAIRSKAWISLLLALAAVLSARAEEPAAAEAEAVLTLDVDSFDEAVAKHPFMVVEFYAPW